MPLRLSLHQRIGLFETESVEPEFDEFDDRWLLRGDTVEMHPDAWQYASPASEWCGRNLRRMWLWLE